MRLRHIEVIQALLQTGHLGTAAEWLQLPVTEVEERLREAESQLGSCCSPAFADACNRPRSARLASGNRAHL